MLDFNLYTLIFAIIGVGALFLLLNAFKMPKSFYENQEKREKLKELMREAETGLKITEDEETDNSSN